MRKLFSIGWKLLIAITVWLTIGWLVGKLRPGDRYLGVELPPWVWLPGIVFSVVGAAGVLICGGMLSTQGIGTLRGEERLLPKDLLVVGPFCFVRNPMSLAAVVLLFGIALCNRSTLGLGLDAGIFILFHLVAVRVEEPGLEKRFGESYREYKRGVPRWVPRLIAWSGCRPERGSAADGHEG